jgi:hypothetical protein
MKLSQSLSTNFKFIKSKLYKNYQAPGKLLIIVLLRL